MSMFESLRQGLQEAIDFAEDKRQIKAVIHDKQDMKEKLLELRGKVDIAPDWQSLREMETAETADLKLDKEEQELLDSFENGEWRRVANPEAEIRRHQDCARNTMEKKCRN